MKRVINPCQCEVWNGKMERAFVEIVFEKGELSLHGVIGPRIGGNCLGAAGQCVDEIREGVPIEEWTAEMLKDLCDIWDEWHLNDMRPYCEHQKEMGWRELAKKKVVFYHYSLNSEAKKQKEMANQAALITMRYLGTLTDMYDRARMIVSDFVLGQTGVNELVAGDHNDSLDIYEQLQEIKEKLEELS